jgi:hypothetical protein
MPFPSLYFVVDGMRPWSVARATVYGGAIGALAAVFKIFGSSHNDFSNGSRVLEIAVATLGFALICAGAAALRNFIARRLVWR